MSDTIKKIILLIAILVFPLIFIAKFLYDLYKKSIGKFIDEDDEKFDLYI